MRALINGPADWRGPDLAKSTGWLHRLTDGQIEEADAAMRGAEARGIDIRSMEVGDFPLPTLGPVLKEVQVELQDGPCIQILQGFPVERYSDAQRRLLYWGLSLYVGWPMSQSRFGDLIGDVRDFGTESGSATGRGYTSNDELNFHCDGCDITALFCLHVAKEGGVNRTVSTVAVHNEMLRRDPELVEVLYQNLWWSRRGQQIPGMDPVYQQSVFGVVDGKFVSRYLRSHMEFGHKEAGVPLTAQQIAAFDLFDSIAQDPGFHMDRDFAPGDMLFINNFRTLHARTAFTDFDDPAKRRHLLRLWLSAPNTPPLPESFKAYYRFTEPGVKRGGNPPESEYTLETTATT